MRLPVDSIGGEWDRDLLQKARRGRRLGQKARGPEIDRARHIPRPARLDRLTADEDLDLDPGVCRLDRQAQGHVGMRGGRVVGVADRAVGLLDYDTMPADGGGRGARDDCRATGWAALTLRAWRPHRPLHTHDYGLLHWSRDHHRGGYRLDDNDRRRI
ncbi:MAG: hypothetical protein MZV65_38945 [Chromatiales bacterium]|nr:hypothetical protein [Chromatiales bacterium]